MSELGIHHPQELWTVEALVEVCGCSLQRILQIQSKALSNIRKAFKRQGISGDLGEGLRRR